MVSEKRLKAMIRLAEYEKGGGKELRIRQYSCRDYIIMSLIRSFLTTTIGYCLLLALVGIGNMTTFMRQINYMDIRALLIWVLLGYLTVLFIYMVITFVTALRRYDKATESVNDYEKELTRLDHMYRKETL